MNNRDILFDSITDLQLYLLPILKDIDAHGIYVGVPARLKN